ncbi:hypothetical protein ILUMI_25362 [Ignelater luminosus]|uniref:Uncharacterized protein n=1 Tax=Ignelater luminosus TaxID=2038154 RepID=A0A8K0C4V7_IGNLU|nr:hypothetical protein ILUMI_25362 [Ignelater luminosus]
MSSSSGTETSPDDENEKNYNCIVESTKWCNTPPIQDLIRPNKEQDSYNKFRRCDCEHHNPPTNHSDIPRLHISQFAQNLASASGEECKFATKTIRYTDAAHLRIFKILYAACIRLHVAIISIHELPQYKHVHFTHLCKPYNRECRRVRTIDASERRKSKLAKYREIQPTNWENLLDYYDTAGRRILTVKCSGNLHTHLCGIKLVPHERLYQLSRKRPLENNRLGVSNHYLVLAKIVCRYNQRHPIVRNLEQEETDETVDGERFQSYLLKQESIHNLFQQRLEVELRNIKRNERIKEEYGNLKDVKSLKQIWTTSASPGSEYLSGLFTSSLQLGVQVKDISVALLILKTALDVCFIDTLQIWLYQRKRTKDPGWSGSLDTATVEHPQELQNSSCPVNLLFLNLTTTFIFSGKDSPSCYQMNVQEIASAKETVLAIQLCAVIALGHGHQNRIHHPDVEDDAQKDKIVYPVV